MTEIRCHPGMGAPLKARALVASDGFSARYDLDRLKGTFSRPTHKLYGENYVGRILVLDQAKGGVATAWMFHEMQARGMAPAALLLNHANPVMAQGAGYAELAVVNAELAMPKPATLSWEEAGALPVDSARMTLPSLTLSPILTRISCTTPPSGAGTSIVALSDSSETSGSSAFTVSPTLT